MMQDVVEEVQQQAASEGAFGRGTSRYMDLGRPDVDLPPGTAWCPVKVKSVSACLMCIAHMGCLSVN